MNPPTFKYRGFGLKIASNIAFPELFPDDFDREDVKIEAEPIDDPWFENLAARRVHQRMEPDIFRLHIPNTGRYRVQNGTLLQMEPRGASDPTAFRMYALTVAFSACLVQRNLMLLHASGIIRSDAVFLFAGASGAGKSTLLARLMQRGHRIFSDDVCVLDGRRNVQGSWLASASYPILKMHPEGIDRHFPTAVRWPLWPDDPKMGVGFHAAFHADTMPVSGVALIVRDASVRRVEVQQIEGVQAFGALAGCTYRPGLIHTPVQQSAITKVISGLADSVPIFQVRRPDDPDDGADLSAAVETLMRELG